MLAKTAKLCDAAAERGIGRRTVGFGKCPPRGDARLALRRLFCGGVHRLFLPMADGEKVVQNHPAKIYKYNKRCGGKNARVSAKNAVAGFGPIWYSNK